MSSPDENEELEGLTRSIDALFASGEGDASSSEPSAERAPEPAPSAAGGQEGGSDSSLGADPEADPEGFLEIGAELFDDDAEESDFARAVMGLDDDASSEPAASAEAPEPPAEELEAAPEPLAEEIEAEPEPITAELEAAAEEPDGPAATDAAEGASRVPEDMVWEEVEGEEEPEHGPADPDALAAAVAKFIGSPALERDGLARDIRAAATALREARAFDPLADAVERLTLAAGDPPDQACLAMARSLVTPGVGARLAVRLGSAREEERRTNLVRLCRLVGHEMAVAVSEALSDTDDRYARRTYLDVLVGMGPAAERVIEEMAEDPRWFVVRNALAILGEVGGDRAVEITTAALAHEDARVRREALLALAKIGGEDARMLVYGMLEDSDPDVRVAAAMAAGELKVERALKPLLRLLEEESNERVITAILQALGLLGDPGAVQAIEKHAVGTFFSRPPTDVRIAAYRALHRIGTPHAKEVLRAARKDKNDQVRSAVEQLVGDD